MEHPCPGVRAHNRDEARITEEVRPSLLQQRRELQPEDEAGVLRVGLGNMVQQQQKQGDQGQDAQVAVRLPRHHLRRR